MPWSFVVIELVVCALVLALAFHAYREGPHWLSTLLWGIVFGTAIELILTANAKPTAQHYVYGQFLVMIEIGRGRVPLWVGVGWGGIAYVSSWTAQRLGLPRTLHAAAAGILAVSIDFSLDPVAELQKYWDWVNVSQLNFFGVPFDNFLGWFAIVGLYAWAARQLFHWVPARGHGKLGRAGSVLWVPAVAAVFATLVLRFVCAPLVEWGYSLISEVGVFCLVFGLAAVIVWYYALHARRNQPTAWIVVALPLTMHLVSLGVVVLTGKYVDAVELLVFIPVTMVVSFLGFTWVSIDVLFPVRR